MVTAALSTFQTVILTILFGVTQVFPLGGPAHTSLIPWFFGWPELPLAYRGLLELGIAFTLAFAYRHEWASLLSSFLQIVIYRRKPMMLDERMPFFLLLGLVPLLVVEPWIAEAVGTFGGTDFQRLGYRVLLSAAAGWLLAFSTRWSRRKWNLYDWNAVSATVMGLLWLATPTSGFDFITLGLAAAFFLSHRHESALRFVFVAAFPYFLVHGLRLLGDTPWLESGGSEMSKLSFWVGIIAAIGSTWIAIQALIRQMAQQPGFKRFAFYRTLLFGAFVGAMWLKSRG